MLRTIRFGASLLVLTLAFAAGRPVSAGCLDNPNSELVTIDDDATCAYTGGGCSVCFTGGPRGGGSWDLCYYDWETGDLNCTYEN